MKFLTINFLKLWKKLISPLLGNNCRFMPTCSEYAIECIERFGLIRGTYKSFFRICRCSSLSKSGFDPVVISREKQ